MKKYIAYTTQVEEELYSLSIPENVEIDYMVVSNWIRNKTANSFELVIMQESLIINKLKESHYKVILGTVKSSEGILINIHIYGLVPKMGIKAL